MNAAVLRARGHLSMETVPRPEPGPREVLLQVAACGVCGSDVRALFEGDHLSHVSRIPGHEPAGVVAKAGAEVGRWREGDRLALAADIHCGECYYCRRELFNLCEHHQILGKHLNGALAEYMLLSERAVRGGVINPAPPEITLREATLAEPMCSVLASHDELEIRSGENVVVIGCGPMGVLHLLLLRHRGARVAMVGRSAARLDRLRHFKPDNLIDSTADDLRAAVFEFTANLGADVVICAAPSASVIEQAPLLARRRGRISLFAGLPREQARVPLDMNRVHYAEQRLVGNFSYHPKYHRQALELLAAGVIDPRALITSYPLPETERALHDVRNGRVLKAVVEPQLN